MKGNRNLKQSQSYPLGYFGSNVTGNLLHYIDLNMFSDNTFETHVYIYIFTYVCICCVEQFLMSG